MWNQWPVAAVPAVVPAAPMAAPPPQPAVPPPLPDAPPPPPPVDNTPAAAAVSTAATAAGATGTYMGAGVGQSATNPYEQYTAAQYAAMTPEQQYALQQHWQQWQTYQQEYAKWHAQYGEQYKREMAAAAAANTVPTVAPAPVAAPVVPNVGPVAAPVASVVPAIGPVYPPAQMGPQMPVQQAQPPPQTYFPQPQMQPAAPQMQPHSQSQMPGKIMAQPQMYNQPPPPPPQVYQQHPQQQQQQQPMHHQQQPPLNQWQHQQPPGRFNQMPPVGYNQAPNPGDSSMFPNLQQPPPSFMQQPPPSSSSANQMDAPWSKGPPSKGTDRGNINEADQRPRWDGPPPDVGQQQQGPGRNNRWQGNDSGNGNNNSNVQQGANKPNQFANRRNWQNTPPGNNSNNMNRSNPFNPAQPGPYGGDNAGASRGGLNSGMGPGSGSYDNDAAGPGLGPGPCNSGNFGGPSGNYGGNFGNNGPGQGSNDNFGPGNFGNNNNNNNRRSGRWEPNRPHQGGGNFGPPPNSNNNFNDSGYNRPNAPNFNQQQQGKQNQPQQQRAPDLDEASFDQLFNQWEKQFEDWKRANANHPDRDEYRRYEEEFEKQRRRIAERREQMRRRRQIQNPQQQQQPQQPQSQRQQQGPQTNRQQPSPQFYQQQHTGGARYGDYEEGEGYSDEENVKENQGPEIKKQQEPSHSSDQDDSHYYSPEPVTIREKKKQEESPHGSDQDDSHYYSPEPEREPQTKDLKQQQPGPFPSKEPQMPQKTPALLQQSLSKPNQEPNLQQPAASQSKFSQKPTQDVNTTPIVSSALGKRKTDVVASPSNPAKQTKQEKILIISLDDDDDDVDEGQKDTETESAVDTPMKNIFKKSDGIPGLDLVADGTAAAPPEASQSGKGVDNNKKIPSLFDVVVDKPLERTGSESEKLAAVSEALPDNVTNALKDPEFMNNLSQALAQAQGREREQQQDQEQKSNERSEHANNSSKSNNSNSNDGANDVNDGRALSFAEWQRKKNHQKGGPQDPDFVNMSNDGPAGSFGPGLGPGPAINDGGIRGDFGPDQRPPHGFGPNGPIGPPFGPGGGQVMGPNFTDFSGPGGPNGPLNGPNFGGPNFGRQGLGPGRSPGPFGGGPGPNGPFGRNFGPPGPNNPNFKGPGPNDRGPNFGPNFRGNGPGGNGPGSGPFRPNFCGPNGPGPGPNFVGPGPFGGPGGPNSPVPFDRNFGPGPNHSNERNFGPGPNNPNDRNFRPGPGPNNMNFNGPNNNSFNDNPFRRNGGPPAPSFDDGHGFGSRGKGHKNFGQQRNNFGNAGNNDNNKPWNDGAEHIGNIRPNEPVYRPVQVFDYQNSSNTAAKVIDYGHKSADSASNRMAGGPGPGPAPLPEFRPGVTFDYGHASRSASLTSGPGAGPMNRNPSNSSNNRKKNKKKNKNRQRLLQEQQSQQLPQNQQSLMLGDELNDHQRAAGKSDDLEDISDGEDNLADASQSESPPPPPKFNKQINATIQQQQHKQQEQPRKAFPANPQRRMLGDPPAALFPSTAAANQQIPEQADALHLEMSVPTNENRNTISIDEVLLPPGRLSRPKRICIILRGPPGCGKSYVARLIKDKEVEMGGASPRILSVDDYFIIENDYEEKCPKSGKKIPKKELLYEYDDAMEDTYMQYLIKSYKKTLSDNLYDFIIVDCNNNSLRTLNEFYCHAKDSNFVPYIVDMHCDVETCLGRNSHQRSEEDIRAVLDNWCTTPLHYIKLDVSSLLENVVEMEDVENMATDDNANSEESAAVEAATVAADDAEDEDSNSADAANDCGFLKSKWENDTTEENLARLDGTKRLMQKRKTASMADYLQLDEWEPPTGSADGKKRVRWADIEEKRAQKKMRAIGFVVGQTDWKRMMDPNAGNRALNKTKYIERVNKRR